MNVDHAIILVGGRGTRLQPLTDTRPKPVLPIVDEPFLSYQLDQLRRHGVTRVVFACGFMPQQIVARFGEGAEIGMELEYVIEPEPLGTGGAIAFAARAAGAGRSLVLNGDVLSTRDLTALVEFHEQENAVATIALTPVDDPSRYGLVRLDQKGAVSAFLEKPEPSEIDTNLINAGTYVLEPSVIDQIPSGARYSVERDVFPGLVGRGLYALAADDYWNDIGTVGSFLRANADVLDGAIPAPATPVGAGTRTGADAQISSDAAIESPSYIGPGAVIEAGVRIGHHSVIGAGARVAAGATVERSVIFEDARIEADAQVRDSIIGEGAEVAARCSVCDGHVVAPGTRQDERLVRGQLTGQHARTGGTR